jgi:anti-sigma regulatory factor (Ser/Thr protein kinase)
VQDITEDKQAEREHRIAETLQRSLLPDRLPDIPGVLLTARYVPASADAEVGGDWYDVVQLPTGQVAVAIGDVAGHGLRAASTMAQLRMGLRAYAIEEDTPVAVVRRVHELAQRLTLPQMATLIYLVFDPERATLTFANAGHAPPLILEPEGRARYLEGGLAPPLGGATHAAMYLEQVDRLPHGSTLVLFTDGLVERRGRPLADGLARLREEALAAGPGLDALCDHLLASMVGPEISDDIALLALRPVPLGDGPLTLRLPAEPGVLAPLRYTMRRWLGEAGASPEEINAVLVSAGEACANVIQHAYGAREGPLEITLTRGEEAVDLTVRDTGRWRASSPPPGGRGIQLMQGLMDHVEIERGSRGTVVRMRHRLGGRSSG